MVEKVKRNQPLEPIRVPVTKRALVIGGGIAGIQAALDIADAGHEVVLVEKAPSIGGHMSQLSETFPTLDCSQCILTPRMVEADQHPQHHALHLLRGREGRRLHRQLQGHHPQEGPLGGREACTGCGAVQPPCPNKKIPDEFDDGLGKRTAIYVPFPQAVPNRPVIDQANCTLLQDRQVQGSARRSARPRRHPLRPATTSSSPRRSAPSWWPPASSSTHGRTPEQVPASTATASTRT